MKAIICDNCGAKDDWRLDGDPFFPGGAIVQLISETGSDKVERTLELCDACRAELMKALPGLAQSEVEKR